MRQALGMQGGTITKVLRTDDAERAFSTRISQIDDLLSQLRDKIRLGERLTAREMEAFA